MKAIYNKDTICITGDASEWTRVQAVAHKLVNQFGYEETHCYDEDDYGECYYNLKSNTTVRQMREDYKLAK